MNKSFRMSLLLLTALVAISISSIPGSALGGNILISSTPSGAYILVDSQAYSVLTPNIITGVLPGSHTIKLSLNGYDDWTATVNVVEGSTTNVSATFIKTAISVSSIPSGANIYLDNQYIGSTPFTITQLLPGFHAIKLKLNGYDDWTTMVNVVEGSTTTVSATLNKTAIYVSSTPSGAYIYLDNQIVGATPFTITQLLPGFHAIKLTLNEYDDWITTVNVVEGSTTPVNATLSIKSSTQNPAPTMITPIITSTSITPVPTYTTTPTPIATFAPKQTQTPLPFYSEGTTPTNTQTTETSEPLISKGWLLTILGSVIAGIIVHRINNKQSKK